MIRILIAFFLTLPTVQVFSSEPTITECQFAHFSEEQWNEVFSSPDLAGLTEEERKQTIAFLSLDWKESGTYKLENSNSTLSLPEGYKLLIGKDAEQARILTCGESDNPELEAAVYDDSYCHSIIFESNKDGYIPLSDWEEFDSKALLEALRKNTERENIERKKRGAGELHVVGWIQEPTLDRQTNTVYWSLESDNMMDDNVVNSVALKLGREGFERITLVTPKSIYAQVKSQLDEMLKSHNFDPGFQYEDHQSGDKLAGYGIAALIAGTLGGKLIKAGGLSLLFKKIIGYGVAALAGLLYHFRKVFKRKKKDKAE